MEITNLKTYVVGNPIPYYGGFWVFGDRRERPRELRPMPKRV